MLSIAIIHAPTRPERIANVERLRVALPDAIVLRDSTGAGDLTIANRRGCWPMARAAWQAAIGDHHLVLEDDAVLCDGFLVLVHLAISQRPDAVISLFRGERECSVATVMPRAAIDRWLPWTVAEAKWRPHHDQLIDLGCAALGIEHVYTTPSIVEHGPFESLLGHPPVRLYFEQSPTTVTVHGLS